MSLIKNQTQKISKILCKYTLFYLLILINISKVLDEHRQSCEQEGKYVEAEMAKNRIAELKQ
jgi:hypothetical protein